MKKFKVSLIAAGVGTALAMTLSGSVLASGGQGSDWPENHKSPTPSASSGNAIHDVDGSAVATDRAIATYVSLDDVSVDMYSASTNLNGSVYNTRADGIRGNLGGDGGKGGSGGFGNAGDSDVAAGSAAFGGAGGNAAGGGDKGWDKDWHKGSQKSGGGLGGSGGDGGGMVGSGALAMAATGNGAAGGYGGAANGGSAGYFGVSNSISNGAFGGASGIVTVSQNMGANALTQQGVTVQGNVKF